MDAVTPIHPADPAAIRTTQAILEATPAIPGAIRTIPAVREVIRATPAIPEEIRTTPAVQEEVIRVTPAIPGAILAIQEATLAIPEVIQAIVANRLPVHSSNTTLRMEASPLITPITGGVSTMRIAA